MCGSSHHIRIVLPIMERGQSPPLQVSTHCPSSLGRRKRDSVMERSWIGEAVVYLLRYQVAIPRICNLNLFLNSFPIEHAF